MSYFTWVFWSQLQENCSVQFAIEQLYWEVGIKSFAQRHHGGLDERGASVFWPLVFYHSRVSMTCRIKGILLKWLCCCIHFYFFTLKWNIHRENWKLKNVPCNHFQIWLRWLIFVWTSLISSHSVTLFDNAGTLRTNITMLSITWWSKEAASVMDTPSSVHLWMKGVGTSSPRVAWYASGLVHKQWTVCAMSGLIKIVKILEFQVICAGKACFLHRFTVVVIVCTTQLEKTVSNVRTFTTTPPGGLEKETQQTSAGVKLPFSLYVRPCSITFLSV